MLDIQFKEEEQTKEQQKTSTPPPSDPPKEESSNNYSEINDKFKGLNFIADDRIIKSSDDVVELVHDAAIERTRQIIAGMPSEAKSVLKYFATNPDKSFQDYINENSTSVNIDSEASQEALVRKEYSKFMSSKAAIDTAIAKLKDDGELMNEAKSIHDKEVKAKGGSSKNVEADFDKKLAADRDYIKNSMSEAISSIVSSKKFDGAESEVRDLVSFMMNPLYKTEHGYVTGFDKLMMDLEEKKDYVKMIEIAKYLRTGALPKKSEDIKTPERSTPTGEKIVPLSDFFK